MAGHVPVCSELEAELIFAYAPIGITVGVAYLGVAMSALAYGVTCCQTFYYYRSEKSKQDHWPLKVLVAFLWLVTGLQEALIIHGIYWYLVTNFMNPCTLISKVIWSIPAEIFLNSPLEIGVEGFLLYRVWKLSRNIIVTGICAAVVVVASVLNIMYSTELLTIQSIQDALEKLRWLGISSLGTSVVADAMITVALVYYLYKSRTGFRRSDDLVTRLTVLTISTGALTTLVTLAELMAYQFGTHGFYVVFFTFLVGKLYLNCMLTTLNMRSIINGIPSETTTPSHGAHSFPLSRLHHHPSLANIPVDMAPPIALHMRNSFDMRSVASQKASTLSGGSPLCREYV